MNKRFYARLAAQNIQKNGKFYKPYLLTIVGTVAAFYMMSATTDPAGVIGLNNGSFAALETILNLGVIVVGLVSAAFLLYTNSFLQKQRGREFGLYSILGMSKKNITHMLLWETVYGAILGVGGGLVVGVLFNKLMLLLLCRVTGLSMAGPFVYGRCLIVTAVVFMALLLIIFLINSGRVHVSQTVTLLRSRSSGEREPKARWFLALLGLGCLGAGYYIAIATTSPLQALLLFFVAVLLVIAGTFLLFLAGSVAVLKLLRKNKRYYYQTRHFVAVSGLMYRIRRNAAGLAILCILSTAVLVMVSTTTSLYGGMEDMLDTAYPWDVEVYCATDAPETWSPDMDSVLDYVTSQGYHPENIQSYRLLSVSGLAVDGGFSTDLTALSYGWEVDGVSAIFLVPASDYGAVIGQEIDLAEGEVVLSGYEGDTVNMLGLTLDVVGTLPDSVLTEMFTAGYAMVDTVTAVVSEADFYRIFALQQAVYGDAASWIQSCCHFDLPAGEDMAACEAAARTALNALVETGAVTDYGGDNRVEKKESLLNFYGGLLFLGIFLGLLFLGCTVCIIYYKQMSEGYEDQGRYEILQKVGMSQKEIAQSIRSQVLLVFFLPLGTAVLHTVVACPMLLRLMKALYLSNVSLFLVCAAISVGVFTLIYTLVYTVTAKTYYRLVSPSAA
jgi:putative ABC transport system permease protein